MPHIVERALVVELARLRGGMPVGLKHLDADALGLAPQEPSSGRRTSGPSSLLKRLSGWYSGTLALVVLVDLGRQEAFQVLFVFHVLPGRPAAPGVIRVRALTSRR